MPTEEEARNGDKMTHTEDKQLSGFGRILLHHTRDRSPGSSDDRNSDVKDSSSAGDALQPPADASSSRQPAGDDAGGNSKDAAPSVTTPGGDASQQAHDAPLPRTPVHTGVTANSSDAALASKDTTGTPGPSSNVTSGDSSKQTAGSDPSQDPSKKDAAPAKQEAAVVGADVQNKSSDQPQPQSDPNKPTNNVSSTETKDKKPDDAQVQPSEQSSEKNASKSDSEEKSAQPLNPTASSKSQGSQKTAGNNNNAGASDTSDKTKQADQTNDSSKNQTAATDKDGSAKTRKVSSVTNGANGSSRESSAKKAEQKNNKSSENTPQKAGRGASAKFFTPRKNNKSNDLKATNKDVEQKNQRNLSASSSRSPRRPDPKTKPNDNGKSTIADSKSPKRTDDKNKKDSTPKIDKPSSDTKPANGVLPKGGDNEDEKKEKKADTNDKKEEEQKRKAHALLRGAVLRRVASMESSNSEHAAQQQAGDGDGQAGKGPGRKSPNSPTPTSTPVPGQAHPAHKTHSMKSLTVPGSLNGPVHKEQGEADDKGSLGSRRDSVRQSVDSASRKSMDLRLQATQAAVNASGAEDKPKSVMKHDDSMIRAAIPALPVPLAIVCLICNIIIPGFGTVISGMSVLCCGKPRLSTKGDAVVITLCINVWVGAAQLGTVTFLLVGWFWSLAWGVKMVILAVEHRKERKREREKELQTLALRAFGSPSRNHRSILPV